MTTHDQRTGDLVAEECRQWLAEDSRLRLLIHRDDLAALLDLVDTLRGQLAPWLELADTYNANLDEESEVVAAAVCDLMTDRLHKLAAAARTGEAPSGAHDEERT